MDDTDEKILAAITESARKPVRQVAEEAGVSREVADYRLKKLEKEGVIKGYTSKLDLSRLAYSTHIVFLQLTGGEDNILEFLRGAKYPHWIGRASGNWDVLFLLYLPKPELDTFLDELLKFDVISDFTVLNVTSELKDDQSVIFGEEKEYDDLEGKELDDVDRRILRKLVSDAKATNTDLAKELDMTAEAVRYRVSKLEKSWIRNYRTLMDFDKLGLKLYAVASNSRRVESDKSIYSVRTTGQYQNYQLLCVKNLEELKQELYAFKEVSKDLEVVPLIEQERIKKITL